MVKLLTRFRFCALVLLALVGPLLFQFGRVPVPSGAGAIGVPPLGEVKEATEQGVAITFTQGGQTDVRGARLFSLRVPAGHTPTPFLKAGAFTARFAGNITQKLRGEANFMVEAAGSFKLKVGGKVVLEADGDETKMSATAGPIKLEKGANAIELSYTSPKDVAKDAVVRLLWSSREFPPEPVQPSVLTRDAKAEPLRLAARLREGRETLATLRCTACHAAPAFQPAAGYVEMPELSSDAPDLSAVGARLKQGWMAAWIADPKALRPDATMPQLFHGPADKTPQEAADLAAYLGTLGKAPVAEKEADEEMVTAGGQLFAGLGCIACHTKPESEAADAEHHRVPLKYVTAKFQAGAIKEWLLDPQKHYKWARMPNFHLSEFEADRLVVYLSKKAVGKVAEAPAGDAAKGKALFASAGCANCHVMEGVASTLKGKSLGELFKASDWSSGCVASDSVLRGNAPGFGMSAVKRDAVVAYAAAGAPGLGNDVMPEFAERSIKRLNCMACHARDEVDDAWTGLAEEVAEMAPPDANIENDQPEEGGAKAQRLFYPANLKNLMGGDKINVGGDQARPTLTWTGEKLQPEWAEQFIAGKVTYKPRYWLRARMPAFPMQAKGIAQGLALEHGFATASAPRPEAKADLAEIGQKLAGRDAGFACITCHAIGDTRAISPFEAPAPNFAHISERITDDFYIRWMRKPLRFHPGTKMPQYSEGGKTDRKDLFDGDADQQFEALRQYLLQGVKMMPPE